MIDHNEAFVCEYCGASVKIHENSCRNHCTECLYSKHMDLDLPGDRLSLCHSAMKPIGLEYSGSKGNMIIHKCEGCKKIIKNIVAEDDNWDEIVKLSNNR